MDNLNKMILQMKRARNEKESSDETLKKPKIEEEEEEEKESPPPQKPPEKTSVYEESPQKPVLEYNEDILNTPIDLEDFSILDRSIYIDQAHEIELAENKGKIWKKGKHEHPFCVEARVYTLPQKLYVIREWIKHKLETWQASIDDPHLALYKEQYPESSRLMVLLVNAIDRDLLTDESLNMLFIIIRFCQISRHSKASTYQFSLSSNSTWAANKHPRDKTKLIAPDYQRLYAQVIKRLIALDKLLKNE